MKFAVLCDLHLPQRAGTAQYDYLDMAVQWLRENPPDWVITAGDITAAGEKEAFRRYLSRMAQIGHIRQVTLLGNSDVRAPENDFSRFARETVIEGQRKIVCINTPYGRIENTAMLETLSQGDVLVMHHSLNALEEASRQALTRVLEGKSLTLIHGHRHFFQDMTVGKSRVIGLRALDPEKSVGAPPCITCFDLTQGGISFREVVFSKKKEQLEGFREFLGLSCFDMEKTVDAAIRLGIQNLELRKYSQEDGLFDATVQKIGRWRKNGGRALSIHMPNLFWRDGAVAAPGWEYALRLAEATGVTFYTMHPPKESVGTVMAHFDAFVDYYYSIITRLPGDASVGIENVHRSPGEPMDADRKFGCLPEEIGALIDGINARFGFQRVGAVLDVGHARNNPGFHQTYTGSMWYDIMGKRAVAYHIHQITRTPDERLHNHTGIRCWFGPMISYSAFFHEWTKGKLNHRPMFLEVRDLEEARQSVEAFDRLTWF